MTLLVVQRARALADVAEKAFESRKSRRALLLILLVVSPCESIDNAGGDLLDEGGEDLVLHRQEELELFLKEWGDVLTHRQRWGADDAIARSLIEGERGQSIALQEVQLLAVMSPPHDTRGLGRGYGRTAPSSRSRKTAAAGPRPSRGAASTATAPPALSPVRTCTGYL